MSPRTMGEKLRDGRWWGEQCLHGLGGAFLSFLSWIHSAWGGDPPFLALLGLLLGSSAGNLREIFQNKDDAPEDNDLIDSHFDAWAFTMGASLSSLIGLLIYA